MGLLDRLLSIVAPPCCAACDAPLSREAAFCAACAASLSPPPPLPPRTTASFAYGGALADAIRSVKFRDRRDRIRALQRAVLARLPSGAEVDVVAPVPLHVARLRTRGFDQAALLARAVGRALDRPVETELLERIVETPRLASLDAEGRRRAVSGVFRARALGGARVLLVDDVLTTGATMGAAFVAIEAQDGRPRAHVLAATPRE